ncbi:MAG: hypothetical protein MMC33_005671 [Icmadophila ericetorum]|nr:hypothetical protein [Icmadophila ericetorum]
MAAPISAALPMVAGQINFSMLSPNLLWVGSKEVKNPEEVTAQGELKMIFEVQVGPTNLHFLEIGSHSGPWPGFTLLASCEAIFPPRVINFLEIPDHRTAQNGCFLRAFKIADHLKPEKSARATALAVSTMTLLFSHIEAECISRSVAHVCAHRPKSLWGQHMFSALDLSDCSCSGDGVLRACKTLDIVNEKGKDEESALIDFGEVQGFKEVDRDQAYEAESEYSESELDIDELESYQSPDGPRPPRLELDPDSSPKRQKPVSKVLALTKIKHAPSLAPEVASKLPMDMAMGKRPVVALPTLVRPEPMKEIPKFISFVPPRGGPFLQAPVPRYSNSSAQLANAAASTGPNAQYLAPLNSLRQVPTLTVPKGKKKYCAKYLFTGKCAFTGHPKGCFLTHVVPRPETLAELGLQELPIWVRFNGGPDVASQMMAAQPPLPIPGTPEYEAARGLSKEKLQLEYCRKYLTTGQCDYMQTGCMLKHKIPSDEMLIDMGYLKKPAWMYRTQKAHTRFAINEVGFRLPSYGFGGSGPTIFGHAARAQPVSTDAPLAEPTNPVPAAMSSPPRGVAADPSTPDISLTNAPKAPAAMLATNWTPPPKRLSPEELKARFPNGKEYCTRWLKRNECEFWQTGCFFKHEAPPPDLAVALGFPAHGFVWWHNEKTAVPVVAKESEVLEELEGL